MFTKFECVLSNSNKIVQARQTNSVTNNQEELLCCIFASEVLTNSSRVWHSLHHLIQLHSWLEAAELELFMSYCCRKLCKPSHWVVVIAWIAIWSPALGEALAVVTIKCCNLHALIVYDVSQINPQSYCICSLFGNEVFWLISCHHSLLCLFQILPSYMHESAMEKTPYRLWSDLV